MGKYLTTDQYKRFGDGISLGDVNDMTLAYMISRSEAAIDAHMGFDAKRGGFEPHQVMIQTQFDDYSRKDFMLHYQVPVRQVTRYRIQVSNIAGGAGFFAHINTDDCVINNDGHYVELVPLQSVTYELSPDFIHLGLNPPIIQLDCEVGYFIPVLGQVLIDGGQHLTYYSVDGFWSSTYTQSLHTQPSTLPPVPPVVYVNGAVQSTSAYTVDYIEGSVTFNSTQLPTAKVTVDFTKTIPDFVTESAVLQTSHLLAQRSLNTMGMYRGLYRMRTGEQEIGYPHSINVSEQGRSQASSLCYEAAAILARYDEWGIA
jgi:hypothetical protein